MKKILIGIVAMFAILASLTVAAAGWGWLVYAESPSAYGWGQHYNYDRAEARALRECAKRTPRNQVCYVVSWEKVWIN